MPKESGMPGVDDVPHVGTMPCDSGMPGDSSTPGADTVDVRRMLQVGMAVYQMLIWQYARRRRYARRHMLTLPLLLILSMAWPSELREYDRSRVFVA